MRVTNSFVWCLSLLLMVPAVWAVDCSTCDCVHLPCPPTCKSCCGISRGRVEYANDSTLKLDNGDTFVLGKSITAASNSQVQVDKAKGTDVTVYFKKLGDAKVAEKVESKADSTLK